jgi:preprotein translocase subunit SecA
MKMDENQPIEAGMVGKAIEQAQIKVEGFFFDQRKRLVELDDVMNKQREVIYKRRRHILEKLEHITNKEKANSLKEQIVTILNDEIASIVMSRAPEGYTSDEIAAIVKEFVTIIPFDDASQVELRNQLLTHRDVNHIIETLQDIAKSTYTQREEMVGHEIMREIEIITMLQTIDELWMDHLDAMDNLRDGIWLRGDKAASEAAYKKEAYEMFERLIQMIDQNVARKIFRMHSQNMAPVNISKYSQPEHPQMDFAKAIAETSKKEVKAAKTPISKKGSTNDLAAAMAMSQESKKEAKPGVAIAKVGRNDLCPCGSGKKYKKCHGAS